MCFDFFSLYSVDNWSDLSWQGCLFILFTIRVCITNVYGVCGEENREGYFLCIWVFSRSLSVNCECVREPQRREREREGGRQRKPAPINKPLGCLLAFYPPGQISKALRPYNPFKTLIITRAPSISSRFRRLCQLI